MPRFKWTGQGLSACQGGVTLVEVMVTIVVMVLLLAAGSQLTMHWVHAAHIQQAHSSLLLGFQKAKALALRNPCQLVQEQVAASLVVQSLNDQIELRVMTGDGVSQHDECMALPDDKRLQWQVRLPVGVQLFRNGSAIQSAKPTVFIYLNNRGWMTSPATVSYRLSKGSALTDETGVFP